MLEEERIRVDWDLDRRGVITKYSYYDITITICKRPTHASVVLAEQLG